jgi:hypothetical protein
MFWYYHLQHACEPLETQDDIIKMEFHVVAISEIETEIVAETSTAPVALLLVILVMVWLAKASLKLLLLLFLNETFSIPTVKALLAMLSKY